MFTGAFHSDTEPLNFLLQPWGNQCCRSSTKPPSSLAGVPLPPAAAAGVRSWGKANQQCSLFWLQHCSRGMDRAAAQRSSSKAWPPEQQEPSLLQDLGMSSAGNNCTWCRKFHLSLWGSAMGAEGKAAAGMCWEETHRENWLKGFSHPYLSPVPISSALYKADSTR